MDKSTYKDYYKILEVDYDATDEKIRLSYRKLALKWHPDKHKGDNAVTAKFQEINEAYTVLSDPEKRLEYDLNGNYEIDKYTLREYLSRFKGMILTCNGLGISHTSIWYVWPPSSDASIIQFPFQVDDLHLLYVLTYPNFIELQSMTTNSKIFVCIIRDFSSSSCLLVDASLYM